MRHVFLLLFLSACSGATDPGRDLGECPVDACAEDTAGTDDAPACCIATHGTGLIADDDLATLATGCEGDTCDPSLYLSNDAAVCIAQACGLSPGIGRCSATFSYGSVGARWTVDNITESGTGNMSGGGDTVDVDALTGECLGQGSWAD